jgi:hypothetical protein
VDTKGFDVEVRILKDGNVVDIEEVQSVAHLPLRTVHYIIQPQNEAATYRCLVSNEYGNDSGNLLNSGNLPVKNCSDSDSPCNNNKCDAPVNPCQNGGTCHSDGFTVTCECATGYTGVFCNTNSSQPEPVADSPDNNSVVVVVSVIVGGGFLMVVLVVVVVILRRRRKKSQTAASLEVAVIVNEPGKKDSKQLSGNFV